MTDSSPSERGIRITSDPDRTEIEHPDATGVSPTPILPLRLLFASDLTPEAPVPDWTIESQIHTVDANNFGSFMEDTAPTITLSVPNRLSDTPERLAVQLRFNTMRDFEPEAIARQVPVLEPLLRVRDGLRAVRDGKQDFPELRAMLRDEKLVTTVAPLLDTLEAVGKEKSTPTSGNGALPDSKQDTLDRLLSLVDDDPPEDSPEALADSLTRAVVGPSETEPRPPASQIERVMKRLNALLGEQLGCIYADDTFRALERSWRSLALLVRHLNFREGIQLEVLPAPTEELNAAIYYQVVLPEHERADEGPPLSAIILDHAFSNSQPDIERLEDLAGSGASLQAPVIVGVAPAFFNVDRPEALRSIPPLRQLLKEPTFIPFNKLREEEAARFLVLALPAFLLRAPYGSEGSGKQETVREDDGLWANGCLAVALTMAGSFAESGWPTHLRTRTIDNLPIAKGAQGYTPLSVLIPESKLPELAKAGFTVLSGKVNHDAIYLGRAQTVALPEQHEDLVAATEARVHVTLPCQLFVARTAHFLLTVQATTEAGTDPAATANEIDQHLRAFLKASQDGRAVPQDAVSVEPVPEAEMEDYELFAVRLRPPRFVLDQEVSLVLGVQIPKSREEPAS